MTTIFSIGEIVSALSYLFIFNEDVIIASISSNVKAANALFLEHISLIFAVLYPYCGLLGSFPTVLAYWNSGFLASLYISAIITSSTVDVTPKCLPFISEEKYKLIYTQSMNSKAVHTMGIIFKITLEDFIKLMFDENKKDDIADYKEIETRILKEINEKK